jgi:hypothetical protein
VADEVFPEGARVGVVTTEPLGGMVGLLDYRAPEGGCGTGDFVEVPLGPRRVLGVVWGPGAGGFDAAKLRSVLRVMDAAPMREELRQAKSPGRAIEQGYERASSAIVDANVTALLSAIIMYAIGSGPVRGFAITLGIGIITSQFTAVYVSRSIIGAWYGWRRPKTITV